MPQGTNNPSSFRLPFALGEDVHPDVKTAVRYTFTALTDHSNAIAALAPQSGETSARPSGNIKVGQAFFDTTLGLPIFWNGTNWLNGQGTVV